MNPARMLFKGLVTGVLTIASMAGAGQSSRAAANAGTTGAAMRYFQLTVLLRYPGNQLPEPRTESITTEVAVGSDGRTGSSKTRMTSQVPMVMAGTTKFMELGTKFDCNNVHVDGNGLALSIVLETSLVNGTVVTKSASGVETEEPLISQRNLELAIKLPLDKPKVIFDSQNMSPKANLVKLGPVVTARKNEMVPEPTLQIEMTATEIK